MKDKKIENSNCRMGTVGGEAVIEGVMMSSKENYSVAVRKEDGSISITNKPRVSLRKKHKILNIPIVRGVVAMIESMTLSFKALNIAAEAFGLEDEEPSKFEKWLRKKFGKSIIDFVMVIAGVLGVALAMGLFIFLPSLFTKLIDNATGKNLGWIRNLIEGLIKITIFVLYLWSVSLIKDIRRTFEYHGAEHKSIFCYESGTELTPENAQKFKRFHPRCGTSLLFVILIISILIFSLPFVPWDNIWLRMAIKLPLIPIIIGIGFEYIVLVGKHNNIITRILAAPGLLMQRITTREPDLEQLEVAITALKNALPAEFPEINEPAKTNDNENTDTIIENPQEEENNTDE